MIRTCAYCDGATYDEDPIELGEVEGVQLRLWVCSTNCAYSLAQNTTLGMTTLRAFRAHFSESQLEVVHAPTKALRVFEKLGGFAAFDHAKKCVEELILAAGEVGDVETVNAATKTLTELAAARAVFEANEAAAAAQKGSSRS